MGVKSILFILIVFSAFEPSYSKTDKNYFNKMKELTELQKNEMLIVIFQEIGSCVKCYLEQVIVINNLEHKLNFV